MVKVFPATSLGPGVLQGRAGAAAAVRLMPTGGVTRENAGDVDSRRRRRHRRRHGAGRSGRRARAAGCDDITDSARAFRRRRRRGARPVGGEGGGAMKTVCFGEIMLRLSPPGFERCFQSPALQATFGGGEANVAVSLAQFGCDSHYVTRLPANPIGDAALRALRAEGVNVEHVAARRVAARHLLRRDRRQPARLDGDLRPRALGGQRAGAGQRAVARRVRRRRAGSTGPASRRRSAPRRPACTREAIEAARRAGARVSVDLNYRRKLWSEAEAQQAMRPLMPLRRSGHRQRRGPAGGARHRGARTPTSPRGALDVDGLSRGRASVSPRVRRRAAWR